MLTVSSLDGNFIFGICFFGFEFLGSNFGLRMFVLSAPAPHRYTFLLPSGANI